MVKLYAVKIFDFGELKENHEFYNLVSFRDSGILIFFTHSITFEGILVKITHTLPSFRNTT